MGLEREVAGRVSVDTRRNGLMPVARFDFQACSIDHSDISPL